MSTEIVAQMPDAAPEYALALLKQYGLAPLNDTAVIGIGAGMPPTIGCKGTRFVVKENGEEKILNRLEIQVVVLAAKDSMTKRFYVGAYNPDAEAEAPDCYSINGVIPVAEAKHKQSEACATCPQNQFGSGTDAQGNPGKGKACGDRKVLALFVAGKVWQFEITPAALKNFGNYVRQQLNPRGLDLRTVLTTIGFDEKASFPQYTFKFGGMVPQDQLLQVLPLIGSPEVKNIVEPQGSATAAPQIAPAPAPQVAAPAPPPPPPAPVIEDDGFGAPAPAPAPVEKPKAVKAKAQPSAPPVQEAAPAAAQPSAAALADALGLDL